VEAVVVSKPKRKISRIFAAKSTFVLADEAWVAIEEPLGCVLDTLARQEILDATREFLTFAEAERGAGLIDDAVEHTKRHRRLALDLIESLYVIPEHVMQGYVYDTIAVSGGRSNLKQLFAELEWFVKACSAALEEMANTSSHHFWPDGFAWQGWIRKLTEIAERHQLPTGARKDTDTASVCAHPRHVRQVSGDSGAHQA
jgi:hypothetical protein